MGEDHVVQDPVEAIALLADPNRHRLYEFVGQAPGPVGRDAAAAELGISRELAAFHLDRLVDGGLLETEYRRLGARRGPGAGRPAKLYRRVADDIEVSLPPRAYARLAGRLAEALDRSEGTSGIDALREVARSDGTSEGREARRTAGRHPGQRRLRQALLGLLRREGYEPIVDDDRAEVRMCNCPYRTIVADHRDLTCGMNHAWAEGVIAGLAGAQLRADLAPSPDRCCVVFREAGAPNVEASSAEV